MYPTGHLAVGYLAYSGYTHARFRESPGSRAAILVAAGALVPDLIDKSLSLAGLTPGRSVAHSVLFAVPLVIAVALVLRRRAEGAPPSAFAISYFTHPIADGYNYFFQGTVHRDFLEVSFWVWPLTLPADAIVGALSSTELGATFVAAKPVWTAQHLPAESELGRLLRILEWLLVVLALCLWAYDGVPGWGVLRDALHGRLRG
jgi:hypothetical protein